MRFEYGILKKEIPQMIDIAVFVKEVKINESGNHIKIKSIIVYCY